MSKVTVYTARKVLTMDPGRPLVQAVAVLDGRVLSTGTVESMQPWVAHHDVTVDDTLRDKVILPGFIEPHTHFWMSAGFMGMDFIGPIPWPGRKGMNPGLATHDDVITRLRELDRERDPGQPIIAWGFDPANQGGAFDRRVLDAISSTRPIWVIAFAPHFVYLNSPAIEATGVPSDTTLQGVGHYPDGSLDGVFNETLAVQAGLGPVFGHIQALGGVTGLHFMAGIARDAGITTVSELMFGAIDFDHEWNDSVEATNNPDFPVRLRLVPGVSSFEARYGKANLDEYRKYTAKNNDRLRVEGIKFFTDGSLPLLSSLVNYPGYLEGGNGSLNDTPWDQLVDRMMPYWEAGIQIHCHANGDEALDATLDALAGLQAVRPRFDHRFSVEHYSISNPMQARRLKALGGVASVNVYFAHFRSLLHRTHGYGPDRSDTMARAGSLEREGVVFAFHSDYPQVVVPLHPLTAVYAAVTRLAEDERTVVAPDERIGLERALRAVTIDAAYVLGMEDRIGSLEQGKFADFAILEEDPFDVEPTHLKDIPVWGTALSGKLFPAST